MAETNLLEFLKATADETRLRILRLLLLEEELNVGELTRIIGQAQSSISKHLSALKRAGLVKERRDGGFTFYQLMRDTAAPGFAMLCQELDRMPDDRGDVARLGEVAVEREDRGDDGSKLLEPGRSWIAWARALRFLLPRLRVADFGCGDGALTAEIATWAESVVAIERSPALLRTARERIEREGLGNVTFREENLEELSLGDATTDLVVVSHCLHFAESYGAILEHGLRVLVPGGRILLLELMPHQEEWVRNELGHVHLGFPPDELETALTLAGFADVEVESSLSGAAKKPFRIVIASAIRPASGSH